MTREELREAVAVALAGYVPKDGENPFRARASIAIAVIGKACAEVVNDSARLHRQRQADTEGEASWVAAKIAHNDEFNAAAIITLTGARDDG